MDGRDHWCTLRVPRSTASSAGGGSAKKRKSRVFVETSLTAIRSDLDADVEYLLAMAAGPMNSEEANGFMNLWLNPPGACRAPISFAAKAEAIAAYYGVSLYASFPTIFGSPEKHSVLPIDSDMLRRLRLAKARSIPEKITLRKIEEMASSEAMERDANFVVLVWKAGEPLDPKSDGSAE